MTFDIWKSDGLRTFHPSMTHTKYRFAAALFSLSFVACDVRDLGDSPARTDDPDPAADLTTGVVSDEDDGILVGTTEAPVEASTAGETEDPADTPPIESPFSPEECSGEAVDACYADAYVACSAAEVPESLCEEFIACRTRTWGCFPNEWDEYEDWEQGVILPLSILGSYNGCGESQNLCFAQARQFCTLRPDLCAEAIAECRPMHESCAYGEAPGAETSCPDAPIHCAAIEASVCDGDETTCAAVSSACDWIPTAC